MRRTKKEEDISDRAAVHIDDSCPTETESATCFFLFALLELGALVLSLGFILYGVHQLLNR